MTGIVEGLLLYLSPVLFQRLMGVANQILWISVITDLAIFCLLAAVLVLFQRGRLRWSWLTAAVFIYVFFAALDWALLIGYERVHPLAYLVLATGVALQVARWFHKHARPVQRVFKRLSPVSLGVALVLLLGIQAQNAWREARSVRRLPPAKAGLPNILLIVVDTLRSDHLSLNHYPRQTSPGLDALAQKGVYFENAFSASSYSLSSHASLLTGQYVLKHEAVVDNPRALKRFPGATIGEALQEAGYATAGFSANTYWVTRETGINRGFIHFEDVFHNPQDMFLRTFAGRTVEKFVLRKFGDQDIPARKSAADIRGSVVRWVDQHRERPFFVFINYMDTHDPYLPPQPFRGLFAGGGSPGGILNNDLGRIFLEPEQQAGEIAAYDGAIAYVDQQIQSLLSDLEARQAADNLLVVITSDHGEAFGEHQTFLHGHSLFIEELHVPLLLVWPDVIPAGRRITRPVTNVDLPATLLDLIGSNPGEAVGGQSLALLWGPQQAAADWAKPMAELDQQDWNPPAAANKTGWLKTLIGPDLQLIQHEATGYTLYNWKADPEERTDLAADPAQGSALAALQAELRQIVLALTQPTAASLSAR